jgi:type IV secretory pathway VirB2 component (pilin)
VLAWAGHMARAVILCIIAYFLIQASLQSDPGDVVNTDKAFNLLGESILGHPAFVVVALGTISYGLYMFMLAWYYEFDSD